LIFERLKHIYNIQANNHELTPFTKSATNA